MVPEGHRTKKERVSATRFMSLAVVVNPPDRLGWWDNILNAFGCVLAMSSEGDPCADAVVDELETVRVAQSGDNDAFGRLVDQHQATIALQMRRFSRDPAVIEELVHDVFVEAYFGLESYRAQSSLIHWLRKIAVRVGYRYWKQRSREANRGVPMSEAESLVDQVESDPDLNARQANETLHELLRLLSPRDRLVLTLIYWDGCTVAEAAELAGWTKTMVRVQAHRARKRLKRLIEESRQ